MVLLKRGVKLKVIKCALIREIPIQLICAASFDSLAAAAVASTLSGFLWFCPQGVEPAPPGVSREPHSQHARRGHQLHPPGAATHPGLQTLLPHAQRPVG